MLYEQIIKSKGDNNALLDLVAKFEMLLKKYASMLNCEYTDAYGDLLAFFIKLRDFPRLTR